ncbi:hypothetical protein C8J56DRAFT_1090177 [Mycena floridula]|nr:hypothetical protein C8J56DRAFT_1090177 [Mycena floridula]
MPFFPTTFPFADCPKCGRTTTTRVASNHDELNLAYQAHYSDYLSSNHSFPDEEAIARQEVALLDIRLGKIKGRMVAATSFVEELRQHEIDLERSIALRKGLFSPIRKIPSNILGAIFTEAHESRTSDRWSPFDIESIPWVVGQVCNLWRQLVCESSSSLWSTCTIRTGGSNGGRQSPRGFKSSGQEIPLRYLPDMVRECLRRSEPGHHALTLTVELGHSDLEITAALVEHCERWKKITWSAGYDTGPAPLDRIKGRLPLLEVLRWEGYTRDGLPSDNDIFAVAPRLRKLEIPLFCQLSFPWLQLQYLQILDYSDEQQRDPSVLHLCRNLVECHAMYDDSKFPPPEPLIFNRLHILQCNVSSLETFVHSPAVEELKLRGELEATTPSIVERLAARPSTVSFTIPSTDEDMHLAVAVLNSLPYVSTLNLDCHFYRGNGPSSLPIIEALRLSPTRQEMISHYATQVTYSNQSRCSNLVFQAFNLSESLEPI